MGKINVLSREIAELIAAGEVVERPGSVIKELVENSIDAGASIITVEIKNGGTTYMRITDNGSGIYREDVSKAFLRNSTSKVREKDDLLEIATLGFRGEALAAVAAVARVDLFTKEKTETMGTRYEIHGGQEVSCEDHGCPQGTTIIVRDLFYNIPARMKFLKKAVSEANNIARIMEVIALSHPEVSFRLIRDTRETLNTPGDGKVQSAIHAVYGREFFTTLTAIDYALDGIKIKGYVCKPSAARANRSMQQFFINGRYIKSKTIMAAMEEAYKGSIVVQKYPSGIMYIDIPLNVVDVNVHPAKIEVRFENERLIFSAIYSGVREALLNNGRKSITGASIATTRFTAEQQASSSTSIPKTQPIGHITSIQKQKSPPRELGIITCSGLKVAEQSYGLNDPEMFIPKKSSYTSKEAHAPAAQIVKNFSEAPYQEALPQNTEQNPTKITQKIRYKVLGEIYSTYIVVQSEEKIILVDKHAAHERIIYEKLVEGTSGESSQILIEPVVLQLSRDEYEKIITEKEVFEKAGFEIDTLSRLTIIVRAAPMYINRGDIEEIIQELAISSTWAKREGETSRLNKLYQSIACRAAVKAGDTTQKIEMESLIDRIISGNIQHCPHGRPVYVTITKKQLEKQFRRT